MKQPKPEPMDYPELLSDIESGELKIPDFQRGIVWDIYDTLRLLDSIAKGFPIGTFIFWESTELLKSHRNVGNLELKDVPEGSKAKYILDGQQRITSLYACLKEAEINGEKYAVYCDLNAQDEDTEQFSAYCADPLRYINVADILGDNPQIIYEKLTTERKKRFNEIRDAFRYYKFATITVTDRSIDEACEIFERINNTGTPLDVFDLMVAKTWTKDFDLRSRYDEFIRELESIGYEGIGSSAILQSVSCILKKGCHRRDILSIKRVEMTGGWDRSLKAIRLAIDFLQDNIKVPVWRLLPYPSIIAPLSYFYHNNNLRKPSMIQARQLQMFFWRACLSFRYSSGAETNIRSDLKEMDKILEGTQPHLEYPLTLSIETLKDCNLALSNAYCKSVLCYFASVGPRNFENNGLVNLQNSNLARANSRQYHHFFPDNYLRRKKAIFERNNSVVNICLIPADSNLQIRDKKPLDYLSEIESKVNPQLRKTLETHMIFDYDDFGITEDSYEKFLDARAKTILDGLNELLTSEDEKGTMQA